MTTEQCSVDSLLTKSRTETFARQLQNRLRTLNGDEVDDLEDTSWNGDQRSSSSEDIYYDLDSYPGSPAEEATEVDFSSFINVKPKSGIYPTPTSNGYSHQSNSKVQFINKDYEHLGQCSSLSPTQIDLNTNSSRCLCVSPSDHEFPFEQCSDSNTSNHIDDYTLQNNRIHHCNHNNSLETSYSFTNQINNNDILHEINDHNFLLASEGDEDDENDVNTRIQCNGEDNELQFEEDTTENQEDYERDIHDCLCTNSYNKSIDVNRNSTKGDESGNVNGSNVTIKISLDHCEIIPDDNENDTSNYNDILNGDEEDDCSENDDTRLYNTNRRGTKIEKFSEEDLSRLVDAVFLKSQEEDFSDDSCKEIASGEEKSTLKVDNHIGLSGDEEETIESKRSKFRRCSSLKSGKTPPGTPGCKKIVRFADVLGLDLADVRTFLDEVPRVPKSAFNDLKYIELSSSPPVPMLHSFMGQEPAASVPVTSRKTIVPLFQQPSSLPEFIDRIRNKFVCLENAVISDLNLSVITGFVRVRNIDFNKSVHVRYSFDSWKSFADLQANYVANSCDGFSDKFTFSLYAHMLNVGQRLEFAVRYHAGGSVHWDNNFGANYSFQCVPDGPSRVLPATSNFIPSNRTETWASFY